MNHLLDLMTAQSIAHERERELRQTLRHRELADRRPADVAPVTVAARPHRVHDLLVRLHLAHAPVP